ncbi:MAG: ribosomal L7Ae/L30e/S12e/Gadd45 family protein [Eubacteriales bacterium]|nr:ribosomal L7Ae/L30e/S12e/Gadd45 family protein [Eubacteriales bacterium]
MQNEQIHWVEELKNATNKAVGANTVLKAIAQNRATRVFLARDVDHFLSQSIVNQAQLNNLPLVYIETRQELAQICGVSVKTAAAAILK